MEGRVPPIRLRRLTDGQYEIVSSTSNQLPHLVDYSDTDTNSVTESINNISDIDSVPATDSVSQRIELIYELSDCESSNNISDIDSSDIDLVPATDSVSNRVELVYELSDCDSRNSDSEDSVSNSIESEYELSDCESSNSTDSDLPPLRICGQCDKHFNNLDSYNIHRMDCRPRVPFENYASPLQPEAGIRRYLHEHALNHATYTIRFVPENNPNMVPEEFFTNAMPYLEETHRRLLNDCDECKVHFVMQVRIIQVSPDGEVVRREEARLSIPAVALNMLDMESIIRQILAKLEVYIRNGSNWIIEGVDWFDFHITRFHSAPRLRGHGFFPLPKRLKVKKAVVNVDNGSGVDCFKYAVLSVLHYDDIHKNRERSSKYAPYMDSIKWDDLHFPMTAAQVKTFEKNNPGLRINMLKWDDDQKEYPVRVLYHTSGVVKEGERIISVLAVDGPKPDDLAHFVGVVNLNRLLNCEINFSMQYCERCLQPFKTEAYLARHRTYCYLNKQETLTVAESTTAQFENWGHMQRLPYVVYADIECFLKKENDHQLERHVPAAFGFLLVPHPGMVKKSLPTEYQVFTGPKCIEEGLNALNTLARRVYNWNKHNSHIPVSMCSVEKTAHEKANTCYMCHNTFDESSSLLRKICEHDHLTGKYRGAACQKCNDKCKLNRRVLPIIFHNLKNYDMHALCASGLGKNKTWDLEVIPQTAEKYMSMKARFVIDSYKDKKTGEKKDLRMTLRFLDSFQFLSASLDTLVRNLSSGELRLCQTLHLPSEDLITAKGVFPYSYFDSFEKLKETALPPLEAFRSSLTNQDVSMEDYTRAQKAWKLLKCKSFGDYMLTYLKRDVYQLADIFENFRDLSLREDQLDPLYYITLPGLSWDSAFKMTGAKVDLLSDISMYEFVEAGIRGGMTFINIHHVTANHDGIPETYDVTQPTRDLLYVDANNLYGHALSQPLPQCNFNWLNEEEIASLDLLNFNFSDNTGLLLEVDLEYPPELQDRTEDLPFAPESATVDVSMVTPLMREQWSLLMQQRYGKPDLPFKGYQKLLLTHFDRDNYIIHGEILQFYLKQGMVLKKIHRALRFEQSAFFEPYIRYNSEQRQKAKSAFVKDYYKLKNNALFGKTMENVRKRMKFRLCNTPEKLTTYASRPEYLSSKIFNEDLVGVHLCKDRVILDKPIFIGQAVLELSKLEMYELRYKHLPIYEKLFGGEIRIMGGDTDSFFLSVVNISLDKQLLPEMVKRKLLDSSNYPSTHPLYSDECKAKLGCIKDESEGQSFKEWVLNKPKMYSMLTTNNKEKKRAKGVRRFTLAHEIRHADFLRAYVEQKDLHHIQRRIGSQNHINFTLQFDKRTISFYEDKRAWVAPNHSLPYGNHQLSTTARRPPKRMAENAPNFLEPAAKLPHLTAE